MSDRSGEPDNDHWQTPQWLYDELDAEFNFDFDPCPNYAGFNGLDIEWGQSNFVNPPYNRRDKPRFIQKAFDEWKKGKTCVLLIPSATGTKQFHDLILPHAEVRFLKGRIAFVEGGKPRSSGATAKGKHDSMIVIFHGAKMADKKLPNYHGARLGCGYEFNANENEAIRKYKAELIEWLKEQKEESSGGWLYAMEEVIAHLKGEG